MRAVELAEHSEPAPEPGDDAVPFWLTTVGYQDAVGGEPSTLDAIVARLKRGSLEKVVDVIGRVAATLNAAPRDERRLAAQGRCAIGLFGRDRVGKLDARLASRLGLTNAAEWDRQVLFHERQCLTLLKIAFLALDLERNAVEPDVVPAVGEALLMVNDLLDRELEVLDGCDPSGRERPVHRTYDARCCQRSVSADLCSSRPPHTVRTSPG
jgi:hypothetical protein